MRRTSLFEEHKKLSAKLIDFGGWQMPISYDSVIKEHLRVRDNAGVFDVSHMGEISVSGERAKDFLQRMCCNDVDRLEIGSGQYTALLNETGGMIDDLLLYRTGPKEYLLCVNASNVEKDFTWLKENHDDECSLENISDEISQIAIQGPDCLSKLERALPQDAATIAELGYAKIAPLSGSYERPAWVARTGYTGEFGFEIYIPNSNAAKIWQDLLEAGCAPIGLGARDTLRLEACYLLYGNDMDESVSPLEAGIGWAVRFDGPDFIGKKALEKEKHEGSKRRMIAFKMEDPGIARQGMEIFQAGLSEPVGKVTSGSKLPSLDFAGGMALVRSDVGHLGSQLNIDVRGRSRVASVMKRPLYAAKTKPGETK